MSGRVRLRSRYAVVAAGVVLTVLVSGCGGIRPVSRLARVASGLRLGLFGSSGASCVRDQNALDYGWPLLPFNRQHPIRGNFGDPRTISQERFGVDGVGDPGDYSFHNGVDISVKVGSAVYPVVSGTAFVPDKDEVIVRVSSPRRSFLYVHILPTVRTGERVVAGRTVLGRVRFPARHVHLTEIDNGQAVNPLLHLRPYQDHTAPTIEAVGFFDQSGRAEDPIALSGTVSIIARSSDTPPLAVPGAWDNRPVGPALIRWRLLTARETEVGPVRTPVDFRQTEPPRQDFWHAYASGTYQNFPVFDHHYYWGQSGRLRYHLGELNTDTLQAGSYQIAVSASDICGNTTTRTIPIKINHVPTELAALSRPTQPPTPSPRVVR